MKKWIAALLPVLLVLSAMPPVSAASSSSTAAIDMHGAKTYLGSTSDWSRAWDEDDFEEVTDDDVDWDGSLTVKSGTVGDITVGSKLTIQGGTMDDVVCDSAEIKAGTLKSVDADGDVKVSGGSIRGDVTSSEDVALSGTADIRGSVEASGEVTLSGTVEIGGDLTAQEVTISSGAKVTVSGTITVTETLTLNNCTLKARGLNGDSSGQLVVNKYSSTLPPLSSFDTVTIKNGTAASADETIVAGTLSIEDDADFSTTSTLELDTLSGPGTLYLRAGKLTVHDEIEEKPLFVFSSGAGRGTTAFYADHGAVDEDAVRLYDYELEIKEDGDTDKFVLTDPLSDGITLSSTSLSLSPGENATIKAYVDPDLSDFATGTKIVWELYGDSSAFSKSADSGNQTCKISVSSSLAGTHRATLIAYLVDSRGDRLTDYRSGSCVLSAGYEDSDDTDSGITLDTTVVSILTGDRYWVLARTSSATAPNGMSYNSSVATVGAPSAARDRYGNPGWIYPITGVGKGRVTIDIGGQKVIASVSSGITIDTATYTMSPGGKYVVGVTTKGVDQGQLWVYSDNSSVGVQYVGKSGNVLLYRLTGQSTGSAGVTFAISGGGSVRTQVTVQNGATAGGSSARLVALAA